MNIHVILCVGNFEVGVHIADVSYFIEEGCALDYTASRRATSVYLIQKVVSLCVCGVVMGHCDNSLYADECVYSAVLFNLSVCVCVCR